MKCRLCGAPASPIVVRSKKSSRTYAKCEACGFIGLAAGHMLTQKEGKDRYLLHQNSHDDSGYLEFLDAFIGSAVLPYIAPGNAILDYGSGPSPVLSGLLKDLGYTCDIYDPAFARTRLWKKRNYSAVLLHEVAEHLKNPSETFSRLVGLVESGGILAIRTRFPPSGADDFTLWWYRMDPTHVGFFSPWSLSSFFGRYGFSTLRCIRPDIVIFRKSQA